MARPTEYFATDDRPGESEPLAIQRFQGELAKNGLARHLAFFYRSPETQRKVAAAFVDHALRTNKRCLYFHDGNPRAEIEAALRAVGVDVDARIEAGDLLIEPGARAYEEADFDPIELVEELEAAGDETLAAGYDGLWLAGETTWCFHTDSAYDHIVEFEAAFDARCPDLPVVALCQYDLNHFNAESVAKALWTHEQVVYRYTLCTNPFYVSPEAYSSGDARQLNTQLMLEQLHDLTAARRRAEQHEQRLTVVNRILRHNIRNDINLARGVAQLVYDAESLPDDHQEQLGTAITHLDDVFEIAEKARYVERTIENQRIKELDLASVLDTVRERVDPIYPATDISVQGDLDVPVVADANLDTALVELFLYAFRSQDHDPPQLSVTVSGASSDRVRVDITYPGPPVPETDRRTVESGRETQLQHCHGLGLWLATWVVENSNGWLTFPEDGEPTLRLELQRGDA